MALGKLCNRCHTRPARADGASCSSRVCRRGDRRVPSLDFDIDVDAPPPTVESVTREHQKHVAEAAARARLTQLDEENASLRSLLVQTAPLQACTPSNVAVEVQTRGTAVPLIVASDWHVEETVDARKVHGANSFDLEEAQRRAHAFARNALRLVELAEKDSDIDHVLVALLGDFFSGSIHEELMETNNLGPSEAARFALDLLAGVIQYWLANSKHDFTFVCIGGNHGRMTKKMRIQTAAENSLEFFMYHALAREFRNEVRVRFEICPGTMAYANLFGGYVVRFVHGNQVGYSGGIGGLTIPLRKRIGGWDKAKRASLTVLGHFHQRLDGGDFLVNGSLIGYNEFAQEFGFSPEEPQQQFALIHERGGGTKSVVAPIWVI